MKTRTEELEMLIAQKREQIIRNNSFQSFEDALDDLQRYTIELYECKKMLK